MINPATRRRRQGVDARDAVRFNTFCRAGGSRLRGWNMRHHAVAKRLMVRLSYCRHAYGRHG